MKVNHERSNKVDNARTLVKILSWIIIVIGVIYTIDDPTGLAVILLGLTGLLTCCILQALFTITYASEIYIYQNAPKKEEQSTQETQQ